GADQTFFGLKINNPTNDITLTTSSGIKAQAGGFDLSTATKNLTITSGNDFTMGAAGVTTPIPVSVAAGRALQLNGKIWPVGGGGTAARQFTKTGAGTLSMGTANPDGTGATGGNSWNTAGFMKISQGTVQVRAGNTSPFGGGTSPSVIMDGGALQFNAAMT